MKPLLAILSVAIALLSTGCTRDAGSVQNKAFLAELRRHVTAEQYEGVVTCLQWANRPGEGLAAEMARSLYELQEAQRPESWAASAGWQMLYVDWNNTLHYAAAPQRSSGGAKDWKPGFYIVSHLYPAPQHLSIMEGTPMNARVVLEFVPTAVAEKRPYRVAWME